MICHKYKTIFIHIPKTGGTSVEHAFDFVKIDQQKNTAQEMPRDPKNAKHHTASKLKKLYPNEFKNYYKWSIVRNPWEKDWSFYKMAKKMNPHAKIVFKDFLKKTEEALLLSGDGLPTRKFYPLLSQVRFLKTENGIEMDKIVRFENLKEEWKVVSGKLNKTYKDLKHLRKIDGDIKNDYDQECIDIVARLRKEDIEYFKYDLPEGLR